MVGYFWLGKVNEFPAGLEPLAGARNMRKATVKIRRNPHLRILPLIRNFKQNKNNPSFQGLRMGERVCITLRTPV